MTIKRKPKNGKDIAKAIRKVGRPEFIIDLKAVEALAARGLPDYKIAIQAPEEYFHRTAPKVRQAQRHLTPEQVQSTVNRLWTMRNQFDLTNNRGLRAGSVGGSGHAY